jgi:glucose-6-phosphate 1-dehydrogenase
MAVDWDGGGGYQTRIFNMYFEVLHHENDKVLSAKETVGSNRMYFLSVPPTVFGNVCQNIDKFARAKVPGKIFVLVEMPFGRDSRSFADSRTNSQKQRLLRPSCLGSTIIWQSHVFKL